MSEPSAELMKAFNDAIRKAPKGATDLRQRGWRAVLAIVEREHEIEIGKLRAAFTLAGRSRDLWRERAIAANWKADGQNDRVTLLHLIRDLTDADECDYDHHGGCQTHGYLSLKAGERCPHEEARELLAANGITEV